MTAVAAEQLLNDAHGFVEELRLRGREIDEHRQLPQELAERLAARGFYRMCGPEGLGGTETGPATMARVCEILGTGNGSAAWCVFIGATSQYTFVGLDPQQVATMLKNPNVITSGVFAASGSAAPESRSGTEGYLVNGSWTWGSGCHNAAWISGGVVVRKPGQDPYDARAYFEPSELDIEDNWHTSGLRGSGSSTYSARGVWLPTSRVTDPLRRSEHADHPLYRFPLFAMLCIPIGAITLGMAQSSIDEVLHIAAEKTPTAGTPMNKRRHMALERVTKYIVKRLPNTTDAKIVGKTAGKNAEWLRKVYMHMARPLRASPQRTARCFQRQVRHRATDTNAGATTHTSYAFTRSRSMS